MGANSFKFVTYESFDKSKLMNVIQEEKSIIFLPKLSILILLTHNMLGKISADDIWNTVDSHYLKVNGTIVYSFRWKQN